MSKTTTIRNKLEDIKNRPSKDVWKDLINVLRTILKSAGYKFET